MTYKKTKIIATLGPASAQEDILEKMLSRGVDCVRLNFSHSTHQDHQKKIAMVRKIDKKLQSHTAIIADIQGPKMRVGIMPKEGLLLKEGQVVKLDCAAMEFTGDAIPVPSKAFLEGTQVASRVFLDDGLLALVITQKHGSIFEARVAKGGLLFSNKGINVPSLKLKGSVLGKKDKEDIAFAQKAGVDYIALSFLRDGQDVRQAKRYISNKKIKIIAKIERPEALAHLDDIIKEADAIMVARGDLGIETPLWELPVRQKEIVEKVHQSIKPVIVATQMLDSMIRNPLPTRAEVSDVANAVYDGADAVMLSGETASGKYPLEAVDMMCKVLESTQPNQRQVPSPEYQGSAALLSVAKSAARICLELSARAIFVETFSGRSATVLSHFRPNSIVVALTQDPTVARQLSLVWGVMPFLVKVRAMKKVNDLTLPTAAILKSKGLLKPNDAIVCVYDSEFTFSDKANVNSITIKTI